VQRPPRRLRHSKPVRIAMTDRERTLFAGAEAVFGAGLVIIGLLLVARATGFGSVLGLVTLVLGAGAVLQAVLVGLGLMSVFERADPKEDGD
jgi:hypothetical protein